MQEIINVKPIYMIKLEKMKMVYGNLMASNLNK